MSRQDDFWYQNILSYFFRDFLWLVYGCFVPNEEAFGDLENFASLAKVWYIMIYQFNPSVDLTYKFHNSELLTVKTRQEYSQS